MDTQQAYSDRLDAQMRAADARLDQMEAAARARNARAEMDEISGLRTRRDRVRQQVAEAKRELRDDSDALRRRVDTDWSDFRQAIAVAHVRYVAWDAARERQFNARLDEVDAELRESAAELAQLAAEDRIDFAAAQDDLRNKASTARRKFDAWRERQSDQRAQRELDDAELDLVEASDRYASARETARRHGQPARAD